MKLGFSLKGAATFESGGNRWREYTQWPPRGKQVAKSLSLRRWFARFFFVGAAANFGG